MGILGTAKLLWYATISLGLTYLGTSPILNLLGLDPIGTLIQGNLKLLLVITTTLLAIIIGLVFILGIAVLTGWRTKPGLPIKTQLLAAFPVGILTLLVSGAFSTAIPVPILPTILSAGLLWSLLRFASEEIMRDKHDILSVDQAEEAAVKFWQSRKLSTAKPSSTGAVLDGNRWIITLLNGETTGQFDVDTQTGIVSGWRQLP